VTAGRTDPARAALDAAMIGWTREPEWQRDDARFEQLALTLFAFQFERCAPYRRFCRERGRTPREVRSWRDVPAVPTGAFKELALTSFPRERAAHVFRTSGTSLGARGALYLDTLAVYEASLAASFARHVLPDLAPGALARFAVLAPPRSEAPDSSLSHMFDAMIEAAGAPGSAHWIADGTLDAERALRDLARLCGEEGVGPIALCGTAFAFVHLLEELERRALRFALPPEARVMETGGFKGRSRSLPREELYGWIGDRLGVPAERIVNQYGMTELGSQFYDSVLRRPGEPRRKLAPPWVRVRMLDPGGGRAGRDRTDRDRRPRQHG
jgi:Acyl-protein synthetase, LuxE